MINNNWEESFANAVHEQWSHWQKYLHTKLIPSEHDGIWNISEALIQRWHSQMNTPYSELTEGEKQSDINIYKKFYEPIVLSILTKKDQEHKAELEMIKGEIKQYFEGLIHVASPRLTGNNIVSILDTHINNHINPQGK